LATLDVGTARRAYLTELVPWDDNVLIRTYLLSSL
jgi:hypothetical protein